MLKLTFEFVGLKQYVRAFDVLQAEAADLREPLGEVALQLRANVEEQFATEGGHSSKWTPLSKPYEEWKESNYPGAPILVRSREMRQAFVLNPLEDITPRRLTWGPNESAVYPDGTPVSQVADAHQSGAGNLPQRRIINLTTDDRRMIDRTFVAWAGSLSRQLTRVTG